MNVSTPPSRWPPLVSSQYKFSRRLLKKKKEESESMDHLCSVLTLNILHWMCLPPEGIVYYRSILWTMHVDLLCSALIRGACPSTGQCQYCGHTPLLWEPLEPLISTLSLKWSHFFLWCPSRVHTWPIIILYIHSCSWSSHAQSQLAISLLCRRHPVLCSALSAPDPIS